MKGQPMSLKQIFVTAAISAITTVVLARTGVLSR